MSSAPPKIKYLTNKDLLEEIHRSKKSFCEFISEEYSNYDFIVDDLSKATPERMEQARKKKRDDEYTRQRREAIAAGEKNPQITYTIDQIPPESIVIRLMTFDHIPINEEKVHKAKTEAERHIKCNFPPFQHFIYREGEFVCVGKSHWRGGLENGEFSLTHGKISNRLAMMFMKLVERYSHRGNWRGYCIAETDEALTQRGWVGINDITDNDIILSYDQGFLKWSKIKSIYRGEYDGLMHKLTGDGLDVLVTPHHKMVTTRGLVEIENLLPTDHIVLMGDSDLEGIGPCEYRTIHVSEIDFHGGCVGSEIRPSTPYNGWVWCPETEYGCFVMRRNGQVYISGNTYNDEMRSQALLQLSQMGLQFDESKSEQPNPFAYYCVSENDEALTQRGWLNFNEINEDDIILSYDQGDLKWSKIHSIYRGFYEGLMHQLTGNGLDALVTPGHKMVTNRGLVKIEDLLPTDHIILMGNSDQPDIGTYDHKTIPVIEIDFHGGYVGSTIKASTPYKGWVWCPETEYGCFVVRRNNKVYLTGNTAAVNNSFTRILNLEKRSQNIRDDLLIMHGALPSYTRQTEQDLKRIDPAAAAPKAKGRGKPKPTK